MEARRGASLFWCGDLHAGATRRAWSSIVFPLALVGACWAEAAFAHAQSTSRRPLPDTLMACFLGCLLLDALVAIYLLPSSDSHGESSAAGADASDDADEDSRTNVNTAAATDADRGGLALRPWQLALLVVGWSAARFAALQQLLQLLWLAPAPRAEAPLALEALWALLLHQGAARSERWLSPGLIGTWCVAALTLVGSIAGGVEPWLFALHATWLYASSQPVFAMLTAQLGLPQALWLQLASHLLVAAALMLVAPPFSPFSGLPWSVGVAWAWRCAAFMALMQHTDGAWSLATAHAARTLGAAALLWLADEVGVAEATAVAVTVVPCAFLLVWRRCEQALPDATAKTACVPEGDDRVSASVRADKRVADPAPLPKWLGWLLLLCAASLVPAFVGQSVRPLPLRTNYLGRASVATSSEAASNSTKQHWRVALWSAAGNGNLGDNIMPATWARHMRALPPEDAPWRSVDLWSVSSTPCCYSFDEWRKRTVPESELPRFADGLADRADLLWVGGGDLLVRPLKPWTHNEGGWQDALRQVPTVWAAVGASGDAKLTAPIAALREPHPPHVLWRMRDSGSASFLASILGSSSAALLPDPVLADNASFPALLRDEFADAAGASRPRPTRVCWVPRTTPESDGPAWIRDNFDAKRDMTFITDEKDNSFASLLGDIRLHAVDATAMFRAFQACDIVISMRYHGCVLGLRALRPTLALAPLSELNAAVPEMKQLMSEFADSACYLPVNGASWAAVQTCVNGFNRTRAWEALASVQQRFNAALSEALWRAARFVDARIAARDAPTQGGPTRDAKE